MHAYVFTDSGCIVDATIQRRIPGDIYSDNVRYVVRPAHRAYTDTECHHMDLLPYGYQSPTQIFSRVGRHTNCGLVQSFDAESMQFAVAASPESSGQPVMRLTAALGEVVRKSRKSFRMYSRRRSEHLHATGRALGELQLLPSLSRLNPTPPLPVGSVVWARRFGSFGLCKGVITAARYDCSYTIAYDDGQSDVGMLHGDVELDSKLSAASAVEPCSVRSRLLLAGSERAEVLECLGNQKYRVVLENDLDHAVVIDLDAVRTVCPFLGFVALKSDEAHISLFQRLDRAHAGKVSWSLLRKAIVDHALEQQAEDSEFTASAEQLQTLKLDLLKMRPGGRDGVGNAIVAPPDDELLISFPEYDYVMYRVKNLFV